MQSVKQFLLKVFSFLGIPAVICFLFFAVLQYINNKALVLNKSNRYITTVFSGDSHVKLCINDTLIPHSINISQQSESYYFTFFKIKGVLNNNPAITKLYLGFSYHNLSCMGDAFIFGPDATDISTKYFFNLPAKEKIRLLRSNANNLAYFLKITMANGLLVSFLGNFENSFTATAANKSSTDKRIALQFYKAGKLNNFSSFNMYYFNEIVKLCNEKKISLILLNTPLTQYYKKQVPVPYINKYEETIKKYGLSVINFSHLNLDDSCFIPDGDHVSQKGAGIVSKELIASSKR